MIAALAKLKGRLRDLMAPGGMARAVALLVAGTALGHAITAMALPILTRIYSPDDFSVLAIFASMVTLASVIACLRLEIAIPLPEEESEAVNLLLLALLSAVGVATVCACFAWTVPHLMAGLIGRPDVQQYIWLLPVAVLLAGICSAMQYWHIRTKAFSTVAKSKVLQTSSAAATQLGFAAAAGGSSAGLIAGYNANLLAGALMLTLALRKSRRVWGAVSCASRNALWTTLCAYARYPKYSTWEALANTGGIQIPVLMIAALGSGPETGYLLLAMTVIQAPLALVGGAIAQVYLSHAAERHRQGSLAAFTVEILGRLNRVGVGPLLALGIISPSLFPLAFGSEWGRAGELVAWMTPWFALQFLASPVSMALHITGQQKIAMVLQLGSLVVRVASVALAAVFFRAGLSEVYALSGAVVYAIYLWAVLWCVRADLGELRIRARASLPSVAGWSVAALLPATILQWV